MTNKTKAAFDNILDCMTGADGGGRFIKFKAFVAGLDEKAEAGDEPAKEIVSMVHRVSKLIDLANSDAWEKQA